MSVILGAVLGLLLSYMGYSFKDWQFWAVSVVAVAFYVAGALR